MILGLVAVCKSISNYGELQILFNAESSSKQETFKVGEGVSGAHCSQKSIPDL